MKAYSLFSRRNVGANEKIDFRPDNPDGSSPFAQLRRLSGMLGADRLTDDDITNTDDALDAYREYLYRKIFGATHQEYLGLNEEDPKRLDWLLAVSVIDAEHYRNSKKTN